MKAIGFIQVGDINTMASMKDIDYRYEHEYGYIYFTNFNSINGEWTYGYRNGYRLIREPIFISRHDSDKIRGEETDYDDVIGVAKGYELGYIKFIF